VTSNERIIRSATKALAGELQLPVATGYCLRLVRIIVEHALGINFYATYLTHRVERAPGDDTDPWARDLERSLREGGHGIITPPAGANSRYIGNRTLRELAQPGDLLFRWDVAPTKAGTNVGHVGILLAHDLVLENINPRFRPDGFHRRGTSVTPLVHYRTTLVARLP
jgi:cell wall-associated NlpC family hydrolase